MLILIIYNLALFCILYQSDHLPVCMCADKSKATSSNILTISFNDANMSKFNLDLQNIDVNPILNETKTNQSYMLLADKYHQVFDNSFPLIQLNNNSKNNWFDKDLQKLLQIKEMFKKYCAKKNLLSKVNYNKARNIYFRTLKENKKLIMHQFLRDTKKI